MSESAFNRSMLALLLLACACLLYLDWRRSGEIEFLHERLDTLSPPTPMRRSGGGPASTSGPEPAPYVAPDTLSAEERDEVLPGSWSVDGGLPPEQPAAPELHPLVRAVRAANDGELDTIGRGE